MKNLSWKKKICDGEFKKRTTNKPQNKEEKKEIIPIITENEIKICASHNFSWPKTQMQVLILGFLRILNWHAVPYSERKI